MERLRANQTRPTRIRVGVRCLWKFTRTSGIRAGLSAAPRPGPLQTRARNSCFQPGTYRIPGRTINWQKVGLHALTDAAVSAFVGWAVGRVAQYEAISEAFENYFEATARAEALRVPRTGPLTRNLDAWIDAQATYKEALRQANTYMVQALSVASAFGITENLLSDWTVKGVAGVMGFLEWADKHLDR